MVAWGIVLTLLFPRPFQIDSDELWTVQQLVAARALFAEQTHKDCAYFHCHYLVTPMLVTTTAGGYSHNMDYEWLRMWRFRPGMHWISHAPPTLVQRHEGRWEHLTGDRCFSHKETQAWGLVFTHHAYVHGPQVAFKEVFYGYPGALSGWQQLVSQTTTLLADRVVSNASSTATTTAANAATASSSTSGPAPLAFTGVGDGSIVSVISRVLELPVRLADFLPWVPTGTYADVAWRPTIAPEVPLVPAPVLEVPRSAAGAALSLQPKAPARRQGESEDDAALQPVHLVVDCVVFQLFAAGVDSSGSPQGRMGGIRRVWEALVPQLARHMPTGGRLTLLQRASTADSLPLLRAFGGDDAPTSEESWRRGRVPASAEEEGWDGGFAAALQAFPGSASDARITVDVRRIPPYPWQATAQQRANDVSGVVWGGRLLSLWVGLLTLGCVGTASHVGQVDALGGWGCLCVDHVHQCSGCLQYGACA